MREDYTAIAFFPLLPSFAHTAKVSDCLVLGADSKHAPRRLEAGKRRNSWKTKVPIGSEARDQPKLGRYHGILVEFWWNLVELWK